MNQKTESSHKNLWKERKIKTPKERAKTNKKSYKGIPILLVCTFTWTHDSAKKQAQESCRTKRKRPWRKIARSALGQVSSPLFPKKNYKGLENVSYSVNWVSQKYIKEKIHKNTKQKRYQEEKHTNKRKKRAKRTRRPKKIESKQWRKERKLKTK